MDYDKLILLKRARLEELESAIESPDLFNDPKKAGDVMREHAQVKKFLDTFAAFQRTGRHLEENRELLKAGDEEMAALAAEEIPHLEKEQERLEQEVLMALLPPDPNENRDALVEIRAGTGGDEASLFAGDLMRMYERYVGTRDWKVEMLDSSPSGVGGFRDITFKVSGEEVFRFLKYESGVHRVQRVPSTETQGRIHTSTATVAVLPEAEEVDLEIRNEDLRIEVCRSSGPGGQGVNTTDSAVQILHIPSGMIVKCQEGRSQIKNRATALTLLRSRLLERKQNEEAEKYSAHRRSLIGSGGREEKIRTYNFPQNRVTDHRIGLTLYNLEEAMQGKIEDLVSGLQASEMEERLKEAGIVS